MKGVKYGIWFILLGIVGLSSSVMAHEVSLPYFPQEWTVQAPMTTQVWRERGGPLAIAQPTPLKAAPKTEFDLATRESLEAIGRLPFKSLRRTQFIALLKQQKLSESQWQAFSKQLKFKREARDLHELWRSTQELPHEPLQ